MSKNNRNPKKTGAPRKSISQKNGHSLSEIKAILAEMFQDWEFKEQKGKEHPTLSNAPEKAGLIQAR